MNKKEYGIKCVIVGSAAVGKTSFTQRLIHDKFDESTAATVGVAYQNYVVTRRDGVKINFELWDTAGQERYRSLAPKFFRGAHCAIVIYDITLSNTWDDAKKYIRLLQDSIHEDALCIVVGNKLDLRDLREVDRSMANEFAEELSYLFHEMSAKEGTNVKRVAQILSDGLDLDDLDEMMEKHDDERRSLGVVPSRELRSTLKLDSGEGYEYGKNGGKNGGGCPC